MTIHLLLQFFFLQSKHGSIRKATDNEQHVPNEKYDMIRHPVQELNLFGDFFMSTGDVADSFSYHMFNGINTYVSSGNYLVHIDVNGTIYALTKYHLFCNRDLKALNPKAPNLIAFLHPRVQSRLLRQHQQELQQQPRVLNLKVPNPREGRRRRNQRRYVQDFICNYYFVCNLKVLLSHC